MVDECWLGGAESFIQGQLESHFFPAWISAEAISMIHSVMLLLTGYFYVLFLWAIAVSDFQSLEIDKNLGLPLSVIIFIVISHADNHFYKYIYLFQILYSIKLVFLLLSVSLFFLKKYLYRRISFYVNTGYWLTYSLKENLM